MARVESFRVVFVAFAVIDLGLLLLLPLLQKRRHPRVKRPRQGHGQRRVDPLVLPRQRQSDSTTTTTTSAFLRCCTLDFVVRQRRRERGCVRELERERERGD